MSKSNAVARKKAHLFSASVTLFISYFSDKQDDVTGLLDLELSRSSANKVLSVAD